MGFFFNKYLYFCKQKLLDKLDIVCYIFLLFQLKFKTFSLLAVNSLYYEILKT